MPDDAGTEPTVRAEGRVGEIVERAHPVLRRLRYHVVLSSALRIDPEGGRGLKAARQRDEHVGRDVLLGEAQKCRLAAIDVHVDLRIIIGLLDVQVDRARDAAELRQQLLDEGAVRVELGPVTCTSSGEGRPKFRIWLTMSAGRNSNWVEG